MNYSLYEFYQEVKLKQIMFFYCGPIAQISIEGASYTLRKNLEFEDASNLTSQAVFSIFIEQAQNILNYSAEKLGHKSEDMENELRIGVVAIGRNEDGHYYISCGNRIYNQDIDRLRETIESVRFLNKDELKALYKERRRKEPDPGSKGAGLGLIEIARKADKPIEYSFTPVDQEFSFFSIRVVVGR
jgi:hypothetical protein